MLTVGLPCVINILALFWRPLFVIDFSKSASARDVYGAGNVITVRGEIDGSVNFAGSKIVFDNAKIRQDVNLAVGSIEFKGDSKIYGTLSYNSSAITTNLDQNKIAGAILKALEAEYGATLRA